MSVGVFFFKSYGERQPVEETMQLSNTNWSA